MNRELEQATFPSRLTGRSNHAELRPQKNRSNTDRTSLTNLGHSACQEIFHENDLLRSQLWFLANYLSNLRNSSNRFPGRLQTLNHTQVGLRREEIHPALDLMRCNPISIPAVNAAPAEGVFVHAFHFSA
jgi:hypothetical protein